MKYPRITYAELLNMISEAGYSLQLFRQIYPAMRISTEAIAQVDEVLTDLGYIVMTPPPAYECEIFEMDYLKHSASKVVSSNLITDLFLPNDISIIARGYATLDEIKTQVALKGYSLLGGAVSEFMSRSWDNIYKVYKAYTTQYKPLENYSMIEDTDYTPLAKQTVKSSNKSKTDTKVDTGVYGFNSTVAVPSSTTDSNTKQEKADNEMETTTSYDGESDNTHHERSGNIGVTTSQQMLESEIKLRKLEILELIFQGLDEVICQSVYD